MLQGCYRSILAAQTLQALAIQARATGVLKEMTVLILDAVVAFLAWVRAAYQYLPHLGFTP